MILISSPSNVLSPGTRASQTRKSRSCQHVLEQERLEWVKIFYLFLATIIGALLVRTFHASYSVALESFSNFDSF